MTSTVAKIQQIELGNLAMIDQICNQLSLSYFLIGGSLLGAIRHHGFIPWDDDVDLGMPRHDYEQFRKYAPALLKEHPYFLQTAYSDSNYGLSYMKLLNRHTYVEEKNNVNSARKGVFIDIFPFDRIPDDPYLRRAQITRFKILDSHIIVKAGYGFLDTPFRRLRSELDSEDLKDITTLKQERDEVMQMYNDRPFSNFKNLASQYPYEKEILTLSQLTDLIKVPFESLTVTIPADYDRILTQLYGNYLSLPPVKQRTEKHISKLIVDNQTFD